jgi:MerR family redox-sensitive transcriptional activator SoxR
VVAKRLGIPLADVGAVFETLPADRMPSIRDWQRVSKLWRVQLEDQRKRIERLEHELTGCIGCGCLSMKACYLLNPEDQLAVEGSGPNRL